MRAAFHFLRPGADGFSRDAVKCARSNHLHYIALLKRQCAKYRDPMKAAGSRFAWLAAAVSQSHKGIYGDCHLGFLGWPRRNNVTVELKNEERLDMQTLHRAAGPA
jgi:hypothetical protein